MSRRKGETPITQHPHVVSADVKRLVANGVLVSLAVVLSIVERWIPLNLLIPVPGIKLGLANIVTLFAIYRLGFLDAAAIVVVRCLLSALFLGPASLLFSLFGGMAALGVMALLHLGDGRTFSIYGVSMAGAAAHNVGQVAAACLILQDLSLVTSYLPMLLLVGLLTGVPTAAAAAPVLRRLKRI
jgi:heptaprenyl diphosphate synthase